MTQWLTKLREAAQKATNPSTTVFDDEWREAWSPQTALLVCDVLREAEVVDDIRYPNPYHLNKLTDALDRLRAHLSAEGGGE